VTTEQYVILGPRKQYKFVPTVFYGSYFGSYVNNNNNNNNVPYISLIDMLGIADVYMLFERPSALRSPIAYIT